MRCAITNDAVPLVMCVERPLRNIAGLPNLERYPALSAYRGINVIRRRFLKSRTY